MKFLTYCLFITQSLLATDIYHETSTYKVKLGKAHRGNYNYDFCKYHVYQDEDGTISMRMGVVGSPVAFFGWDISFDPSELPLEKGFSKSITSGMVKMLLSYDGKTLSYAPIKQKKIWNRIYPFSIEVDTNLDNPKKFRGSSLGYQKNLLGKLRKNIVQKCIF